MGGGKSGGGSQTVGYRYYMTLQMVLGRGPMDEIVEIQVGDKTAWPFIEGSGSNYDSTITDDRVISINAPNLFGGDKAEGGIQGSLTLMMGKATQFYPQWVKNLLGGDVPDFRGTVTAVFDGLICALNPYPKPWKFRLRRILKGWDGPVWRPELAVIDLVADQTSGEATQRAIKAMNGAHILYECVTNRSWGRGYDRARINDVSWTAAAQTLKNEGFGLCLAWKRDGTIGEFIGEVIRHIGASMYVSRETGLLELKLIRGDYNPADLPLFDYNSGLLEVEEPETATLADAIGEVIVSYRSPMINEELQVRAQNLAVIQSGEGINTQKVSYPGLPNAGLAGRVAARDLKTQSIEQSRYKCKFDRRAWKLYPGAVFRISAPDKGISNLVLRAAKLQESDLINGEITCEAVIDVFGLPSTSFSSVEENAYTPPSKTPEVVSNRVLREATYYDVFLRTSVADRAYIEPTDTAIATIGSRANSLMLSYDILSKTGSEAYVSRNVETFAPTALLDGSLGPYDTTLIYKGGFDMGLVTDGMLVQLNNEIFVAADVTANPDGVSGTITLVRGVLDTIPASHANNARLYFLGDNVGTDLRDYAIGETVNVKLLSNTSDSQLDEALAPADTITLVGRQGRPYPPAGVVVKSGSNTYPCLNNPAVGSNFSVEWTHRDRVTQQDRPVGHWEASVGPESGVSYNLRFYATGGTLLASYAGLTGTSAAFTAADSGLIGNMRVELESVRGGYTSLQKYSFTMSRTLT